MTGTPILEPWADDPFKVLGLAPDASEEEIRNAYFALVKERSPERAPEDFKRVRRAYEALRSASGRHRSHLMIFEAEKESPVPTLPPLEPITADQILEDLLLQEEIAVGLRDPGPTKRE